MNGLFRMLLSTAVAGSLLACGPDPAPKAASAPAAAVKRAAPVLAEVVPEPEPEYQYNPEGKKDPFQSFIATEIGLDSQTSALERFDLSQLIVTAIVWGPESSPKALITDPAGKGYVVGEGTPIGKNKGRIVQIRDNLVRVKETYVDFRDQATTKEVEMRLYESQGG
jgi:type IV pilus assembly protein PilP